jgi:hypothetical protein
MTEQMPGELIYEYTIQSTRRPRTVCPRWTDALLSGVADIPPQGARYDLAFQRPIVGQRLRGTVELTDYIHIRPDGRVQLHIHAQITTEDGKKIALYADGVAQPLHDGGWTGAVILDIGFGSGRLHRADLHQSTRGLQHHSKPGARWAALHRASAPSPKP